MFLQELYTSGLPDIDDLEYEKSQFQRKYRQRNADYFWNRFRSEYSGQLRQNAFKKENSKQLKIGDIIFLEDSLAFGKYNWNLLSKW